MRKATTGTRHCVPAVASGDKTAVLAANPGGSLPDESLTRCFQPISALESATSTAPASSIAVNGQRTSDQDALSILYCSHFTTGVTGAVREGAVVVSDTRPMR